MDLFSEWERSARRAGPNAAAVLVILSKHTFYKRFHSFLCQRNYEQVRLVHLIVIAVPVPQIQEQIVDVIKVIPEKWMSKRTVQQIVACCSAAFDRCFLGVVVRLQRHERQHGWTCPQPPGAEC